MARKGNVLVLASAMLTLAACSSGDDATPSTPVPTTATVATTSAAPTTTSAPSTTQAPTTTIDPAAALAAEVEADLLEAFRLGREAWQDPFDVEKEEAALDRRLGIVRDDLAASLADYRDRNYALRPSETVPASVAIEDPPEFAGPKSDVARVRVCEVNSWVLVEVGAGPNGTDAIVNDDILITRSDVFMRNVDGGWKFEGGNELGEWQGIDECPGE